MKPSIFTIDSTTGFYDLYAPIYDWEGYIFNIDGDDVSDDHESPDGDEIQDELYIPYECII